MSSRAGAIPAPSHKRGGTMTTIIEHPEYGRVEGNRECWDIDGSEYYEKDGCRRYRDDGWMVVEEEGETHHD